MPPKTQTAPTDTFPVYRVPFSAQVERPVKHVTTTSGDMREQSQREWSVYSSSPRIPTTQAHSKAALRKEVAEMTDISVLVPTVTVPRMEAFNALMEDYQFDMCDQGKLFSAMVFLHQHANWITGGRV